MYENMAWFCILADTRTRTSQSGTPNGPQNTEGEEREEGEGEEEGGRDAK